MTSNNNINDETVEEIFANIFTSSFFDMMNNNTTHDNDIDNFPNIIDIDRVNINNSNTLFSTTIINNNTNVDISSLNVLNNTFNMTNFINRILNEATDEFDTELFNDPLNDILRESMETAPTLEKRNEMIDLKSQLYTDDLTTHKNCCICLEEFNKEDYISILKCSHVLHTNCIKEWSQYNTSCPICRDDITNSETKELS